MNVFLIKMQEVYIIYVDNMLGKKQVTVMTAPNFKTAISRRICTCFAYRDNFVFVQIPYRMLQMGCSSLKTFLWKTAKVYKAMMLLL